MKKTGIIFLSYGSQESAERSLKVIKALSEFRALKNELDQVTKETKSHRFWLNNILGGSQIDDPTRFFSNTSDVIPYNLPPSRYAGNSNDFLSFPESSNWNGIRNLQAGEEFSYETKSFQLHSYDYAANVFGKGATGPVFASQFSCNNGFYSDTDEINFPTRTNWFTNHFKSEEILGEPALNETLNWQEVRRRYFLYVESSLKQKKLRKRSKKAKKEIRELQALHELPVRVYNSTTEVFQKLQSNRINDKSGDEFNNLETSELSRLLKFKN